MLCVSVREGVKGGKGGRRKVHLREGGERAWRRGGGGEEEEGVEEKRYRRETKQKKVNGTVWRWKGREKGREGKKEGKEKRKERKRTQINFMATKMELRKDKVS